MSERTFDDFDEFASDYRSIHTKNLKLSGADSLYFAAQKVAEIKQTESKEKISLLDIGCGDGAAEIFFHKEFPLWQLQGIDITKQGIDQAIARNIPTASFQVYNGISVPFADETFDVVFMAAVLHHISFALHPVMIAEICRVLKKGGRLYLFEHNPLNPFTKYLVATCPFDKDAKLLYSNYTARLLKRLSFKSVKGKFILFFPRRGVLSKLIWLEKKLGWLPLGGQYYYRAVKQN